MGMSVASPFCVHVDNAGSKSFARGTCMQSKLRGCISMRWSWVQDVRNGKYLDVRKVSSEDNLADLLTKTHGAKRFKVLLKKIQGTQRHRRMAYYMGRAMNKFY